MRDIFSTDHQRQSPPTSARRLCVSLSRHPGHHPDRSNHSHGAGDQSRPRLRRRADRPGGAAGRIADRPVTGPVHRDDDHLFRADDCGAEPAASGPRPSAESAQFGAGLALALFLTAIVMGPTFTQSYNAGIKPLLAHQMELPASVRRSPAQPVKRFMLSQVDRDDLGLFLRLSKTPIAQDRHRHAAAGGDPRLHDLGAEAQRSRSASCCSSPSW